MTNELMTKRKSLIGQKEELGAKFRKNLTLAWYFDKFYEKLILIILGVLGLWKLTELMRGIL